LHSKKNHCYSY